MITGHHSVPLNVTLIVYSPTTNYYHLSSKTIGSGEAVTPNSLQFKKGYMHGTTTVLDSSVLLYSNSFM